MASGLDRALQFVFDNVFYIVLVGALVYFIANYLKIKRSTKKIINRNEVERLNFIERMSQNKPHRVAYLYYDRVNLGLITNYKTFRYEEFKYKKTMGKDKKSYLKKVMSGNFIDIHQFVVRPTLLLNFPNPFSKLKCFQIGGEFLSINPTKFIIKKTCYLDYIWGIFYDESTVENTEIIKNDNVMRTDLNQLASIYFAKSQEQTTFDPEHAHSMALLQRQLQIELAKKKGQSETI